MNITINNKKVTIEQDGKTSTHNLGSLRYHYTEEKDSVTLKDRDFLVTSTVNQTVVNGVQMTNENIDQLLEPIFFSGGSGDYLKLQSDDAQVINSDIALKSGKKILLEKSDGTLVNGLSIGTYGSTDEEQIEIGSETKQLNLNTIDKVTVDTQNGQKTVAYSEDISESSFNDNQFEIVDDTVSLKNNSITNNEIADDANISLSKIALPEISSNTLLGVTGENITWRTPLSQGLINAGTDGWARGISAQLLKANLDTKINTPSNSSASNNTFLSKNGNGTIWANRMTQTDLDNSDVIGRTISGELLKDNLDKKQDKLNGTGSNRFLSDVGPNDAVAWISGMTQNLIDSGTEVRGRIISAQLLKSNLDKKQDKLPSGASNNFLSMDSSLNPIWRTGLNQELIDGGDGVPRPIQGSLLKSNLDKKADITGATGIIVLTQAEYDAISTKNENTIYFIKE